MEAPAGPFPTTFRPPLRAVQLVMSFVAFGFGVALLFGTTTSGSSGSCASGSTCGASSGPEPMIWVFLAFWLFICIVNVVGVFITEVRLEPDAIVRRRIVGTRRYPWSDIVDVTLDPIRQFALVRSLQRGSPKILLRAGKPVFLTELRGQPGLKVNQGSTTAATFVAAVRDRLGNPPHLPLPPGSRPLPPPPTAGRRPGASVSSMPAFAAPPTAPRRARVSKGPYLVIVLVLLGGAIVASGYVIGPPRVTFASRNEVPAGRAVEAVTEDDGTPAFAVICRPSVNAAFGDDELCRDKARGQFFGGLAMVVFCLGLIVVVSSMYRRARRRLEGPPPITEASFGPPPFGRPVPWSPPPQRQVPVGSPWPPGVTPPDSSK